MYEKSLKIKPRKSKSLSVASVLKTIGERKKSEGTYQNAIKYFPLSGEGILELGKSKETYKFSKKEIANMELSIAQNIHPNELIQMHFALGKAYESNKQVINHLSIMLRKLATKKTDKLQR